MIKISEPKLTRKEIKEINKVIKSGHWIQGERVKQFEEDFAKYIGVKHAIAVGNGTQALHLALESLDLKPLDMVISTPFTFVATNNMIKLSGASIAYVDVGSDFCIDPEQIETAITPLTKAIMVVHLYGQPANMAEIMRIAREHNLYVIEDACQAHGARYGHKKVGSIGDVGVFSFYPTKNMTTFEGGMITTNNDVIERTCRLLRNHGQVAPYEYEMLGYNYRMTDIQATLGIEQLKTLDKRNAKRIENAKYYNENLQVPTPNYYPERTHVYNQYTIYVEDRDKLQNALKECGIETRVYYPISHPVANHVLSIPVHPNLKQRELEYIVKCINNLNK